ncbi:hypothetical protein WL95_04610 [Burkholderia cepacia]|nr:hypothetical protein WL95_04610 [Burkholderia cepacia]
MGKRLRMSFDHAESFASSEVDRSLELLSNRTSKSQPGMFDGPSHASAVWAQLNTSAAAVTTLFNVNNVPRDAVGIVDCQVWV